MKAGERIAGFGLIRCYELRNFEYAHLPGPLAWIDIADGRICRSQIDADDVAAGLGLGEQIGGHEDLVATSGRLVEDGIGRRPALRLGILPNAELQLPAGGGFGALAPELEDAEL